jgi:hypothetical protein
MMCSTIKPAKVSKRRPSADLASAVPPVAIALDRDEKLSESLQPAAVSARFSM